MQNDVAYCTLKNSVCKLKHIFGVQIRVQIAVLSVPLWTPLCLLGCNRLHPGAKCLILAPLKIQGANRGIYHILLKKDIVRVQVHFGVGAIAPFENQGARSFFVEYSTTV